MGTNNSPAVSIIGAHHVPVRMTLGSIPGRTGINMIIRIDGLFNRIVGDEQETPVPLPLNCAIATYGSQWRPDIASFGVDPGDPGFIIVPDIHNNTIHITKDSGRTWDRRDDLVNLITDNGKYLFTLENDSRERFEVASSQVSCIRFDPSNHNNIAMGTAEAGLILSTDHGKTWKKISHSEKIGNITDISFNGGKMFVSSWGSGIWCISFD
jgi:hypothetical protein